MLQRNDTRALLARDIRFSRYLLSLAKGLSVALFVLLLASTLMSYAVPYAMKLAIDSFLSVSGNRPNVLYLVLYLLAILLSVATRHAERYICARQGEAIEHRFRDKVVSTIMHYDIAAFRSHEYGQLQTALTNAISTIDNSLYCIVETSIIVPFGLAAGLTYIARRSYTLVPLIAVEMMFSYFVISRGAQRRAQAYKEQLARQSRYFGLLETMYRAFESIRLTFRAELMKRRHAGESEKYSEANVKHRASQILIDAPIDLANGVFAVAALYIFYLLISSGRATLGDYFAFVAMKDLIIGNVNGFLQLRPRWRELRIATAEINGLIVVDDLVGGGTPDGQASPLPVSVPAIEEIRFHEVGFSYPGTNITYQLDYRFTSGHKYLLVGENGIGKTTVIRMLAGLCSLDRGEILVNGTMNLKDLSEGWKRSKMAVLPQDIIPFDDVPPSGPTGPTRDPSESATAASLSGGQKKMAVLSSIFTSQADIIILDEPYAELDAAAKDSVTKFINEASLDRILIVVSHEIPDGLDMHNAEVVRLRRDGTSVVLDSTPKNLI